MEEGNWYYIELKKPERHPPRYAKKFQVSDNETRVKLSNGSLVNFTTTQEEARERYRVVRRLDDKDSKRLDDNWEYELHR
jgi:hypothetical protein